MSDRKDIKNVVEYVAELSSDTKMCKKISNPYLPPIRGRFTDALINIKYRTTYHIWKRLIRRQARRDYHLNARLHILDIGCGPGNFIRCLEHWFHDANIVGLDMSRELVEYTMKRSNCAKILQSNAEYLPFRSDCFDVISALQVVEHLSNPEKLLDEVCRILRKNSILLLATPNPQGAAARLMGNGWGGIRDDHISLRRPEGWHALLEKSGFIIHKEGTTLFNGIPFIGRFPLGFPFQVLQALFGFFPWRFGESYMMIATKV